MKALRIIMLALLASPLAAFAGGDQDDFGTWLGMGVEKSLPKKFSVGLEAELRTEDNCKKVDRMNIGLSLGYKINKNFKLGVSYNFMESYTSEKRKEHYKSDDDDEYQLKADGSLIWNGYKVTASRWTPKHRFSVDAGYSVKLTKWLRFSIRERYQFTKSAEVDGVSVTKYRYATNSAGELKLVDGEPRLKSGYPETSEVTFESEKSQVLRSRFKFEVDKKRLKWKPYVSVEFHNDLGHALKYFGAWIPSVETTAEDKPSMHLLKLRTCVGTGYQFNRHHTLDVGYVLTNVFDESPNERMHALSLAYQYKF